MSDQKTTIIYTETDEAPILATYSLLPIIKAFAQSAGISVETRDISLAGRIMAAFPEYLSSTQQHSDDLTYLGKLTEDPNTNIIKLPNISASVPQMKACIKELQDKGYALPRYTADEPKTDEEFRNRPRYDKVKGSAVNPVLREGNSDRRAPASVKQYARNNPHKMGAWSADSKSHVAHMTEGDFFGSEKSVTVPAATSVKIVHTALNGVQTVLKEELKLKAGEIIDASVMSVKELRAFYAKEFADAKANGTLVSIHLKATMMKVSDPIIFGHAVSVFFADVFEKYADELHSITFNAKNGLADLYARLDRLPEDKANEIKKAIMDTYAVQANLGMVNSYKGITNLHFPNDVIVDASMPAVIRESGKYWDKNGNLQDTKAIIPDRCYAGIYQEAIDFCKKNGAFDPRTMGTVPNVGLMAQQAEEYGSHDKTFEITVNGKVQVVDAQGQVLLEHEVDRGDIWRLCQTKDAPVQDWVKLAVNRARLSNTPAIFWLNKARAHDAQIIAKVEKYLKDHDTKGLDISIKTPEEACRISFERIKEGKDTISVTGNVLRDYLTDLFPILELGTSAKMLSIVPLMAGGGLFETGAGGSAPKHVQQLLEENFLRWDSLGEFMALSASFEHMAQTTNNAKAAVLAETLDVATGKILDNHKSPGRELGELDNRGSHFFLAQYWAEALAAQNKDAGLKACFSPLVQKLKDQEATILKELMSVQGHAVDVGGYYRPDPAKATEVMRPSKTFNALIDAHHC
ncbi:MAG: hypothetical protein RL217_727 [Pseudomonadota bacterium]|jgi:isocitrate dehydrogenase